MRLETALPRELLTDKQSKFVDEYLVDLNATQAAIRAGYSHRSAGTIAAELMANPEIKTALDAAKADLRKRTEVTQERVVAELAKLAFSNIEDFTHLTTDGDPVIDLTKADRDQFAAITEITTEDFTDGRGKDARDVKRVKIKLADKRAALVDLGKHLGMFVDRSQVEHNVNRGLIDLLQEIDGKSRTK